MDIREYRNYREEEIRRLYEGAGWTAYTENMPLLERGYRNSLLVLAAYEDGVPVGIARAVGDGVTVVFIQDVLVLPDRRRRGIGTALVKAVLDRYPGVRQIQLTADDTPELNAFYRSLGFSGLSETGCRGYMKLRRIRAPEAPAADGQP